MEKKNETKTEFLNQMDGKERRFTLRNDYAFKKVFGSNVNKEPLTEFLSLVLGIPKENVEEITIENPFFENQFFDDKKAILDLKLTLKDGKKINIEMQNYWQTYFIPRVLYYWSKRYIEDFKEKSQYNILKPCISINILNERFRYSDSIHSVYELLERDEHSKLENYLELHFLDLTKLKDKNMSLLEKWLLFIETDNREVRDMLSMESAAMKEANKVFQAFYTNPNDRYAYEAAERLEAEKATLYSVGHSEGYSEGRQEGRLEGRQEGRLEGRQEGRLEGRQEGRLEGRQEGRLEGRQERDFEIVRNMRLRGLSDEDILNLTGINKDILIKL